MDDKNKLSNDMKQLFILIAFVLLYLNSFSQQQENLSFEEEQFIIEEIIRCTETFEFLQNSKECISLMNLSFNSESLNYNDSPWCNSYLSALISVVENHNDFKYCNISWESREIIPMSNCQSEVCGIFCYKIITNMGCTYCGRNSFKADFEKSDNGKWLVQKLKEISFLPQDNISL